MNTIKVILAICGLYIILSSPILGIENKKNKIPQEALRVIRDSNAFAFDLYKQMSKSQNICFSPFSISSAFAMVYTGAMGDTKKEIAEVLHYSKSIENTDRGWSWLSEFLTFYPSNSSADIRLRIANALWIQANFPVLPAFRDMMSEYFKSTFRFVDFKSQVETARSTINAWVKQNTFGKIADILPPQSINNSTRMVLVSALYLKAKWKNPFDIHATNQEPFFLEDGTIQTTLSMIQTAQFPYFNTPDASLLEMPYIMSRKDGPEFSMLIILPRLKDGLKNVEKDFSIEKFEDWIHHLAHTRAIISIPKFKIVQSSNLNDLFLNMGMKLPFSDQADFSGISPVKGLKIGNILHKVYLAVDETGSEASAATAIGMNTTAIMDQNPPVIFQVDHPFSYIIFEKSTGIILFMGRVSNPNSD